MAVVKLTNSDLVALVDDQDYGIVSSHRWLAHKTIGSHTYYVEATTRGHIRLHRLIMGLPDSGIDHINGNGLDNRRSNLRIVTQAQQNWNRQPNVKSNKTSGYKGVHYSSRMRKWVAQIGADGKRKYLGCFDSESKAARVYNDAARRHYGAFARLNVIREIPVQRSLPL